MDKTAQDWSALHGTRLLFAWLPEGPLGISSCFYRCSQKGLQVLLLLRRHLGGAYNGRQNEQETIALLHFHQGGDNTRRQKGVSSDNDLVRYIHWKNDTKSNWNWSTKVHISMSMIQKYNAFVADNRKIHYFHSCYNLCNIFLYCVDEPFLWSPVSGNERFRRHRREL